MHNKNQCYNLEEKIRVQIDQDREQSLRDASSQYEQAAYITKIEQDQALQKKLKHKKDLDMLIS